MEVPFRGGRGQHILNVHIHRRENASEFVHQSDVDVTLNVLSMTLAASATSLADVPDILARQFAVEFHQRMTDVLV